MLGVEILPYTVQPSFINALQHFSYLCETQQVSLFTLWLLHITIGIPSTEVHHPWETNRYYIVQV